MSSIKVGIELVSLNANAAIADLNKYTQSLTSLDQAGEKASSSLESSMGTVDKSTSSATKSASSSTKTLGKDLSSLGSEAEGAGKTVGGAFEEIEKGGDTIEGTGKSVEELGTTMEDAAKSGEELGSGVEAGTESLSDLESGAESAAGSTESLADASESAGQAVEQAGSSIEDAASSTEDFGTSMEDVGSSVEEMGSAVEGSVGSIEELSGVTTDAASGNETLATSADTASDSLGAEGQEAETASSGLETLSGSAETAASGSETLTGALESATVALVDTGAEGMTTVDSVTKLGESAETSATGTESLSMALTGTVTPLYDMNTQLTEATTNQDTMGLSTEAARSEIMLEHDALVTTNEVMTEYNTGLLDTVTNTTDLTTGLEEELVPLTEIDTVLPTVVENQELFNTAQEESVAAVDESVTSLEGAVTGLEDLDEASSNVIDSVTDLGDTTSLTKDQTDQFTDASNRAQQGQQGWMTTSQSTATAMVGLGASIVSLWQNYDSLGDAQLKVDKAAYRLRGAQKKLQDIQDKLNILVQQGKTNTQEYRDLIEEEARAKQNVANLTGTYENAQEDLNTTLATFYTTVLPNIITVGSNMATMFDGFLRSGGAFPRMKDAISNLSMESFKFDNVIKTVSGKFGIFTAGAVAATAGLTGMHRVTTLIGLTNPFFIAITVGAGLLAAFITNAWGFRDAVNGIGVALGNAVPLLKPWLVMLGDLGGALAALFGDIGNHLDQTAARAEGSSGKMAESGKNVSKTWTEVAQEMAASDVKIVSDYGTAVLNIQASNEQMTSHFQGQITASVSTWGQFVHALSKGDIETAVDLMISSFAAIPSIIMTIANDAIHHFGTVGSAIGTLVVDGLQMFVDWGIDIGLTMNNAVKTVIAIFAELGSRLVEAISPTIHQIAEAINSIPTLITLTAQGIWDHIVAGWGGIANWVSQYITTPINNWISGVTNTVQHAWNTVIGKIGDVGNWAIQYIGVPINKWVSGVTQTVQVAWNTIIGKIGDVGNWAITHIGKPINRWVSGVTNTVQQAWNTTIGKIGDVGNWAVTHIGKPINQWTSGVTATVQQVWNSTIGVLGDVANWVKIRIVDPFNNWVSLVTVTTQQVWNQMGMDDILNLATDIAKGIGEAIMSIPSHIKNLLNIVWKKLGLEGIPKNATIIADGVVSALSGILNGITGIAAGIYKKLFGDFDILGAADKLGKGIVSTLQGYINTLGAAFAGMGKAIQDAFKLPTVSAQEDGGSVTDQNDDGAGDTTGKPQGGAPTTNIGNVTNELKKVEVQSGATKVALEAQMDAVATTTDTYTGLGEALKKNVTEYGEMHTILNSNAGVQMLESQGTMQRVKAYQDLQVQLVQNRAYNKQYMADITTGNALNTAYATGVEAQKKALMDQAVALATTIGKTTELTAQMQTGLPQFLAYTEGVYAQKDALIQLELATQNTFGMIAELSAQLATGKAEQLAYNAGVAEAIMYYGEEVMAIAKTTGELDVHNEAIKDGIAQENAYIKGQQEVIKNLQETEISLSHTAGAQKIYSDAITLGIPQFHAYNQAQADVRQGAMDLVVEFASLKGTADAMFQSLGSQTETTYRIAAGFEEGRVKAAEWGYQLAETSIQNEGFMRGLFELADVLGTAVPEGTKHTEESLKAYIATMQEIPSHLDEVTKKMYDTGLGIAQEFATGMEKGGEEADKAIETLKTKVGVDMPSDIQDAVQSAGIGENMLETLRTALSVGLTAFDNVPLDSIKKYTGDLAANLLAGLGEMDESSRAVVEGTMNEINALLLKGPENTSPQGIQKWLAELDALMLKAQAQADPTGKKLNNLAAVKADPSTWISLEEALKDGHFSASELANGITGISTSAGGVVPSLDNLKKSLADGKITQDQYNQAVAALQGYVDPASQSLTGAKAPTDHLGEAFMTSAQKLGKFAEIMKLLPAGVTEIVGKMNLEWAKQDPLPVAVAQKMMLLGQVLVQVPLDVTTAVTGANNQFLLLNPMPEAVVTAFTNLGTAIANIPVQFTTAFNTVNMNVAGVMSQLATTTFTQFFANMTTMVANIPVEWTTNFNTVFSNVQGVMSMLEQYMTTWFTTHASTLQTNVPVAWTTAFNTVLGNVQGVMTLLDQSMTIWFTTHTTNLSTIPVAWTEAFNTILQNSAGSINMLAEHLLTFFNAVKAALTELTVLWTQAFNTATQNAAGVINFLAQHLVKFFTGLNGSLAQVPVWWTAAFNRGTQNAAGMINQLFKVCAHFFTQLNSALGQVPTWFTSAFNRGAQNAAGMINQLFKVCTHFFTQLHSATGQVPVWFTSAFGRAAGNVSGYMGQMVSAANSMASSVSSAASRAASGITTIGNAASRVISQVNQLKNALNSLPNISRSITYTVRTVGTLPPGARLSQGTSGAMGTAYLQGGAEAVVGENGKEIVQISRMGINGRPKEEKTFVTNGVTRVDYSDKMLTVIPLQGRNAELFALKNPQFRSLQEGVNSGTVRLEEGTAYNTDGVYEKGFVKKGGWGASRNPADWRVRRMKDNPKLWKVTDRSGDNVATHFSSEKTAKWYIGSGQHWGGHTAGKVLHGGWGGNQDPDSWRAVKMRDNPKLWKIVDANGINIVTDFANELAAKTYILKRQGKLPKPPTGGGGGGGGGGTDPPIDKPPTVREASLAARMQRPDLGNAVPDYQRDQTGRDFTMPADPTAREFGFNAGAYELGKPINTVRTPVEGMVESALGTPTMSSVEGARDTNGVDYGTHITRLYQKIDSLIEILLSKNLNGNALWQDQSRIASKNVGNYL